MDPYKATVTALDYLKELHRMYNDWGLALAAYNCGPGSLNKAIKLSGKRVKNFWDVQPFLPAETQDYVPSFIAATYVANYYNQHGLEPTPQSLDELFKTVVSVDEKIDLEKLAIALNISTSLLKKLNPSYKKTIIKASTKGNYITIPHSKLLDFTNLHCDVEIVYAPNEVLLVEPATEAFTLVATEVDREAPTSTSLADAIPQQKSYPNPVNPDQVLQKAHIINDRVYKYLRMSRSADSKDGYAGVNSTSDEVVSVVVENQFMLSISTLDIRKPYA
jgi:hypothetical protein